MWAPPLAQASVEVHGAYSASSFECEACHGMHSDPSGTRQLLRAQEKSLCYSCHGTGAQSSVLNVETGSDSFGQPSAHVLEESSSNGDLTNSCSSCHNPHEDPATNPNLVGITINGVPAAGRSPNGLCLACHNEDGSWEPSGYPDVSRPERNAFGYPVKGTFPGATVASDPARNAHSNIPTSSPDMVKGDCRNCHGAHGGSNVYDILKQTFRPTSLSTLATDQAQGDYAQACFMCHGGQPQWLSAGATDIKSFATTTSVETTTFSGHRIETFGATLPAGSPLMCSDCHNPHGSSRGNSVMISDELGQSLSVDTSKKVRQFCFTCHTSGDGMVWNSEVATYTAVSPTATVSGLRRDGTLLPGQISIDTSSSSNWVRLSSSTPAHSSGDSESCYTCHGGDETPGGHNIHNPQLKVPDQVLNDAQTKPCYDCHSVYQAYMEDGSGAKQGSARTSVYHHVLGGAQGDGDINTTSSPTSTSDVYCLSCHRGHRSTEESSSAMMLASLGSTQTASSDYTTSSPYGICISCHGVSLSKDTVNQLSDGTTTTARVTGGTSAGGYGASAHSYATTSTLSDGSVYSANCSKCHSERANGSQTIPASGDGMHWSADRRLIASLGGTTVDPAREALCFRCHSRASDIVPGTKKLTAGFDWYGSSRMSLAAESTLFVFSLPYSHDMTNTATQSMTCSNCHNPHAASATSTVSDPWNSYVPMPYSAKSDRTAFCLRCHSGSLPGATSTANAYVPWSVTATAGAISRGNKSTFVARSHVSVNGSIAPGQVLACDDCHDKHGSRVPKMLGRYDAATNTNRIGTTAITANDNSVCFACHTSSTTATQSYDASGYPTDGRWPGSAVFNGPNSAHTRSTVSRPGLGYAGGDCKNCHDVHGTSATYDELVGSAFTPTYFGFCFDCHSGGNVKGYDQKRYFPVSAGGTSTDIRAGHASVTAGIRPAGSPLACYNCHNNHGSANPDMLEVHSAISSTQTVIVGDGAGEIDMTTDIGVRRFCFTCHVPNNTSNGWNGSAMVPIAADARVAGILRTSTAARLKLPSRSDHLESSTKNCEGSGCHGKSYTSATSNNVHQPRDVAPLP